jgi:hypothetical protein
MWADIRWGRPGGSIAETIAGSTGAPVNGRLDALSFGQSTKEKTTTAARRDETREAALIEEYWGAGVVMFPVVLIYTCIVYWIFRGKVGKVRSY